MMECPPGQHRTLVLIDTGTPLKNHTYRPYICLSCGASFVGLQVRTGDSEIDEVLKLAAEDTINNLRTLRVKHGVFD